MTLDPAISWFLALMLAMLLGVAAGHKLADRERYLAVLKNYDLMPEPLVPLAGAAVVAAEIAAVLLLVLPSVRTLGACLSVALFATYALAIAVNLLRGRTRIDCGCFGFGRHDRIAWTMVVRNLALVALALALLLPASQRDLVVLDALTVGASLLVVALLAATFIRLGALPLDRRGAR